MLEQRIDGLRYGRSRQARNAGDRRSRQWALMLDHVEEASLVDLAKEL
jgi:hypothetical protein